MKKTSWMVAFACLLGVACSGPEKKEGVYFPEKLDRRDKMRYQQYLVRGKELYMLHCSNCHQADGKGLAKLYPPLAKSDYLMADLNRAACTIKFGNAESITVNGVKFNMMMPGMETLTALEIAEIMTFVTNSWGNENGFVTTREVQGYLENCGNY
ncbi:MAG: cytochrome c [Cyclobacteriaceae bacterium]|nr:cytochrome c [Cyclobacteriaceae bacterium]